MIIKECRNLYKKELQSVSSTPLLDVDVLLCFFLSCDKTHLLLNDNQEIDENVLIGFLNAIENRKKGIPIAYIINKKSFYGYDFYVDSSVLIPKPDTETLVEKAVVLISEKIKKNESILTICDMCSGSGCIAISVLLSLVNDFHVPYNKLPKIILVDISKKALDVSRKNAELLLDSRLNERVRFLQSNLFEMVPYKFDVILTNPPYVPHFMVEELLKDGRSEPRLALDGDVDEFGNYSTSIDGLSLIKRLIVEADAHLAPYGFMLMETGEYNAEGAENFGHKNYFKTKIYKDINNQLRVVQFEK